MNALVRSAPLRSPACSASTPTRSARSRSRRSWGCPRDDRRARALDHLLVGQRARDELPRALRRTARAGPRRALSRAEQALVRLRSRLRRAVGAALRIGAGVGEL